MMSLVLPSSSNIVIHKLSEEEEEPHICQNSSCHYRRGRSRFCKSKSAVFVARKEAKGVRGGGWGSEQVPAADSIKNVGTPHPHVTAPRCINGKGGGGMREEVDGDGDG